MKRPCINLIFMLLPFCCVSSTAQRASRPREATAESAFFETNIRPIIVKRCQSCHDQVIHQGGLSLTSAQSLARGGDHGATVQAGSPEKSLLSRAIHQIGEIKMPPDGMLKPDEIGLIDQWIRIGAIWPDAPHGSAPAGKAASGLWSLQPVSAGKLRKAQDASLPLCTRIDHAIAAKLSAAHLTQAGPADRRTLIRRATYDLTGLPPTQRETAAFVADRSPNAYQRLVERLLNSPTYGEQYGRHWLDVVRYADTAGENTDHPLPHAWRYRNWVIDAFNANMPYNQFLKEQIAGDILAADGPPDRYASRIVATGFLAIARRFGHDIDQDVHLTYDDTIDTVGKSMLGLTLGCARCHDHKFDPISSRDYYALYGIFSSTKFSFPGCEPKQQPRDLVPLAPIKQFEQEQAAAKRRITQLESEINQLVNGQDASARKLKSEMSAAASLLSVGEIPDGGSADIAVGAKMPLNRISVRRGDVIQLSVTPLMSHGADSTQVEWTLKELGEKHRAWSVGDLVDDLAAANPNADRYGSQNTWYFLDAQDGFRLMPERMPMVEGRQALHAWRNGDTPSVFANSSTQPIRVWTTLPARSFFVHPGPKGPVAVAWISPVDGEVAVQARITDVHPGGPDGVGWILQKFHTAAGALTAGQQYLALASTNSDIGRLRDEQAALKRSTTMPVAYGVTEGTPHDAHILRRGEPTDPGEVAPRQFLAVLGGQKIANPQSSGRLDLANWIANPANPLTARVMVNRLWQWHFGRGLVKTPNDFGTRGAPPTHPELLDMLAEAFVKSGWNIKLLQREIMMSAAYRCAATAPSAMTKHGVRVATMRSQNGAATQDPADLYATFQRRRLTAEEIRDSLLSTSGELDRTPGQAHPFPPEATWSFTQHQPFSDEYETMKRSVYIMHKRNRRIRFFMLFDGADPNSSTPVRDLTTVPTQALFFMNDPFIYARAQGFCNRITASSSNEVERIHFAYREALQREPTTGEISEAKQFISGYLGQARAKQEQELEFSPWSAFARLLLSSNEYLYLD